MINLLFLRDVKFDLCKHCGSGGELITCEKCTVCWHIECCDPPLRRAPRAPWTCAACKGPVKKERRREPSESGKTIFNSGLSKIVQICPFSVQIWSFSIQILLLFCKNFYIFSSEIPIFCKKKYVFFNKKKKRNTFVQNYPILLKIPLLVQNYLIFYILPHFLLNYLFFTKIASSFKKHYFSIKWV